MSQILGSVFAYAFIVVGVILVLAVLVCAYLVPVNIFRIAQHLRGIREQTERIAAALERRPASGVDEFRELELARRRRATTDTAGRPLPQDMR